ncbi:hypothetical protein [Longimicrobium sp.]|uniref:hypothetical protein n=1 Tax=Longimicrobium sp. TaxID=2029185 RepID=UPI002CB19BDF|nr:hypothetical protein [Longimicrobium sp.]HSU14053.1 hypothetical protein [Longimicrobium sp.]
MPGAYTTSLRGTLEIRERDRDVDIVTLGNLPGGSYVVFAKAVVVTRVDSQGRDSALAQFSLETMGGADKAMTTLWHSSDRGSLQPADTISLQLPIPRLVTTTKRGGPFSIFFEQTGSVTLFGSSIAGTLEVRDVVLTAIKVDSVKVM